MIDQLIDNNYSNDIKSNFSFNKLVKTYQEKMPSESSKFLETVLKIGLEEKIKIESEKYYHPLRFLAKSFILKK
jgi:hypothetical protein